MSRNDGSSSKKSTAIKLAPEQASERVSGGRPDPGPGDLSAAPSSMPERVELPEPPTASELVVKSENASGLESSGTNPESTTPNSEAPEPDADASANSGGSKSDGTESSVKSASKSGPKSSLKSTPTTTSPSSGGKTSRKSGVRYFPESNADSGAESEQESGAESEAESNPESSPKSAPSSPKSTPDSSSPRSDHSDSRGVSPSNSQKSASGQESKSPSPSGSKMSSSGSKLSASGSKPMVPSIGKKRFNLDASKTSKHSEDGNSDLMKSMSPGGGRLVASTTIGKDGKKHTKYRYHKRITVRTKGKTRPEAVMAKVNKKDHKAGITISTLDNLDSAEVMKRAGLKPNDKGHWRLRLRQTKTVKKNGSTHIETKVAYRDSKGNKNIKTTTDPYCKKCGKEAKDCKCTVHAK